MAEHSRVRAQRRTRLAELSDSHWASRTLQAASRAWMDVWVTEELIFQAHEKARSFRLRRALKGRWLAFAEARLRVRNGSASAARHWMRSHLRLGLRRWVCGVTKHEQDGNRRAKAYTQWRRMRQREGFRVWVAASDERGAATRLLEGITRFLASWRLLAALSRCVRLKRTRLVLRATATLHLTRAHAEAQYAGLERWRSLVLESSHKRAAFQTADGHFATRRRWKRLIELRSRWTRWRHVAGGHSKVVFAARVWRQQRLGASISAWRLRLQPACVRGAPGTMLTTRADEWGRERREADGLARWRVRVRFAMTAQRTAAALAKAASRSRSRALRLGWDVWRCGWSIAVLNRHAVAVHTRKADEFLTASSRAKLSDAMAEWSTRSVYRLQKQRQRKEAALLDERVKELRTVLAQGRKWAQKLVAEPQPC